MKKICLFLLLVAIQQLAKAQNYVSIPDTNFVVWLQTNIPSAMNGILMDTTDINVTSRKRIIIQNSDIATLDGIQYFDSLKTLNCSNALYDTLQIKINTIPALPVMLDTFICNNNSLTILPLLPNNLILLSCNFNRLSHLPVLPNTIRIIECLNDSLTNIPTLPDSLITFDCSNNHIDSLPNLPSKLTTLNCIGNSLHILPTLPNFLVTLNCDFNQLQSLPILPNSLNTLNCSHNNLTSLPTLFDAIMNMDCSYNQITVLPSLPNYLPNLFCNNNQLTTLPTLPSSITFIDCSFNQISALPTLPTDLIKLNCNYNILTTLPTLPNTLEILHCRNNQLPVLPSLPASLIDLDCGSNQLPVLPTLPNTLSKLACYNNQLPSLPSLPTLLSSLNCSVNQISILPPLSSNLGSLNCSHNLLDSLPTLPNSLVTLECNNNSIMTLPSLPSSLSLLYCNSNQLSSLPTLPINLVNLDCSNNNIHCFDAFGNISNYLDISNNPFSCIPNYIPIMDAATLNVPLCLAGNPFGCPSTYGIVGFTYKDSNTNCLKDSVDIGLKNIPMKIYDSSYNLRKTTFTASNGVYQFLDSASAYTIEVDTVGKPFQTSCVYPGLDSTVNVTVLDTNVNFALTCKTGFDVGVQSISHCGLPFPGQTHTLRTNVGDISKWYNLNCASGISGNIRIVIDGPVSYLGPAPGALTPVASGNVLEYDINDFGSIQNSTDFNILLQPYPTAQDGDLICTTVDVSPVGGDNNPSNNHYKTCYAIVNSHDPNIKETYPEEVKPNFADWFTYTIYFQNTGSAPAFNIHLIDTLDQYLDLSTFQVIDYSHNNTTTLTGKIISVQFPNIMLPDSASNPEGSIGFIQYRVKPKTTWPNTRKIRNTAYIYFDFNPAIVTNSTYNSISKVAGLIDDKESLTALYPNPCNGSFTIELNSKIKQEAQLFDITGNMVLNEVIENGKGLIQVSNLPAGVYNLTIKNDAGITNKKLIIVK